MNFIKSAKYIKNYLIELEFENEIKGVVDLSYLVDNKGVFLKFQDLDFFKSFFINQESKTLEWPGEIDLCPDNLYSKII